MKQALLFVAVLAVLLVVLGLLMGYLAYS